MGHLADMHENPLLIFRVFCFIGLLITLGAGWYIHKNFERYFGVDPSVPSEKSSGRTYTRVQVFALWAHAVVFFALSAMLMH